MTNKQFKEELKKEYALALEQGLTDQEQKLAEDAGEVLMRGRIYQLKALYNLIQNHPELTSGQITFMIKGKESLKFLNKFIDVIPYGVECLKQYGVCEVGNYYACLIMNKKFDNLIKNRYREYLKERKLEQANNIGENNEQSREFTRL